MEQIRLRLKVAILSSGKTQEQVAAECGLSAPLLSNIVTGRVRPNLQEQKKIAKVLGRPHWQLFSEVSPEELGWFCGSEQAEEFRRQKMRRMR